MKKVIYTLITIALESFHVSYAQNSERIITAGSVITETVCALGDCDKIIASDRTSLYPEIRNLPSIGRDVRQPGQVNINKADFIMSFVDDIAKSY